MKTFEEWLKETNPEFIQEGWVKNLAIGGALVGAGLGLGNRMSQPNTNLDKNIKSSSVTADDSDEFLQNKPKQVRFQPKQVMSQPNKNIESSKITSDDVNSYLKVKPGHIMSKYNYNSEIGRYEPIEDEDGSWIYRTKQGDYKRIKNSLGNFKFVKIN